jgi:hypothetical protein
MGDAGRRLRLLRMGGILWCLPSHVAACACCGLEASPGNFLKIGTVAPVFQPFMRLRFRACVALCAGVLLRGAGRGVARSCVLSGNDAGASDLDPHLTAQCPCRHNITTFFSGQRHFFHRDSTTLFRRSNNAYNSSVPPVRVAVARPCAHDRVNRFVFIWWPPAGRHPETGATEDCNLSHICVWNHFKLVE